MTLLEKVKALFAEEKIELAETVFVKTKDGQIFLVKSPKLDLEADIVLIDEAGTEQVIEDGDYILEDGSTLTVLNGKVAEIATAEEESTEDTSTEEVAADEVKLEKLPAGDYTLDNGDSITVDENQVVVNWIKADAVVDEPVVEEMEKVEEVVTVNVEAEALKVELEKVKAELEAKALELNSTKESFEKLQKQPATSPLDTRKFEKAENKKESTLLSKVKEITNKK